MGIACMAPAHALDGMTVQHLMANGQAGEARQLALQAAGEGDWRAAHFASWAMLEGIGGPVDRGRGLALAAQAAASGDWIARYDQAKALSESPETAAEVSALFTALAGEGYSPACCGWRMIQRCRSLIGQACWNGPPRWTTQRRLHGWLRSRMTLQTRKG